MPDWVFNCFKLQVLSIEYCECIDSLPIAEVLNLPDLKELACEGCSKLYYPAQEICKQGGKATLKFLQEVNGQVNTRMNLFLIGEGEAGKTSVVMALKSSSNSAYHIRTDHRTIGIDITSWKPKETDMFFDIFDLAGQAVYSKTHQIFLLRRAAYIFVWRADNTELQSLQQTIVYWLDSLQNRVPGSFVLLVVTHIDQVPQPVLESQCSAVKTTVAEWLVSCKAKCSTNGTQMPSVFNDGESFKVDCLSGDGIIQLRKSLLDFIKLMPWYKEGMPSSWMDLQARLTERSKENRNSSEKCVPYLSMQEYKQIAGECGVPDSMMQSVTEFFA